MTSSFATAKLQNPNGQTVKKVFPPIIVKPGRKRDRFRKQKSVFPIKHTICFLSFFLQLGSFHLFAQAGKQQWVDSVFQRLTTAEKIGQLFMIPVSSSASKDEKQLVLAQIKKIKPGCVLVMGGSLKGTYDFLKSLQSKSNIPMLAAINAEWGLGQTLDSTMSFSKPLALGAIRNDSLIFQLGREIGRQMKLMGIHMNFAPNADIDVRDDLYPGTLRYFSENKKNVVNKSILLMNGLRAQGILTVAKHLANQKKDRHLAIKDSSVVFDINHLDTIGFYPYQKLIESKVDGVITSHLDFVLEGTGRPVPAPISELFVNGIFREKLGYAGLTIAEIPHLIKLTGKTQSGDAEALAFTVGHDILIGSVHMEAAVKKISAAVSTSELLKRQLDKSVKKILAVKFDAGLDRKEPINDIHDLEQQLHSSTAQLLQMELVKKSITLLKNSSTIIPIETLVEKKFATISFGNKEANEFNHYLLKYAPFQKISVTALVDTLHLAERVQGADVVIVALFPSSKGLLLQVAPIVKKIAEHQSLIICSFGDPEDLKFFEMGSAILAAFTDDDQSQKAAAQIIFGGLQTNGKLPITITESLREGQGETSKRLDRLSYSLPEDAGMDNRTLEKIALIMQEAVDMGATPGCQVVVAKNGKVVYEKSVGWLTYEKKNPVTDQTIYDLASVTKVSATLQAVMYMHEKGLIDVNKKASYYLPELKQSNKKDFIIKDILTHQAGLWPFLPFWSQTMEDSLPSSKYYSTKKTEIYPFPVADNLFASNVMKDSLWSWIIKAKVREKVGRTAFDYRYSDMGFYILQHLAETMLHQPMEEFLAQQFYDPMGAYSITYLPLRKFPASQIAPTENDKLFRKKLLVGYVHDQGAAMHGGIAGHAGLFSSANDLAKLGQMWLQKGSYGGRRYFKPETLELFTKKQYESSRRGLGWDKPLINDPAGPTSINASSKTFGHTGFTGTCIWVDPAFDLVYVFLSNRVYPDMNNNKILNANIRPRIQDVIYQSIFNYSANQR